MLKLFLPLTFQLPSNNNLQKVARDVWKVSYYPFRSHPTDIFMARHFIYDVKIIFQYFPLPLVPLSFYYFLWSSSWWLEKQKFPFLRILKKKKKVSNAGTTVSCDLFYIKAKKDKNSLEGFLFQRNLYCYATYFSPICHLTFLRRRRKQEKKKKFFFYDCKS